MYSTLLLALLFLHIIGDFYLQSTALAEKKKARYPFVLLHSAVYAAVFFAGLLFLRLPGAVLLAGILAALHFMIDSLKFLCIKPKDDRAEAIVYCVDQGLHIACIIAAVILLKTRGIPLAVAPWAEYILAWLPVHARMLLQWLCLLAFIWKPASMTVRLSLTYYKPDESAGGDKKANTGAFIGILERILIALLMSVGQYAAIGLVLTAKSVARYEKLKDQTFAEYYLLGTLLSTLLVVAAYLALFVFI